MRLLTIISIAVLMFGTGCARKEQSKETELERAYRLIDLKRGAEAILVLDPYYNSDPKDREVLLALASAHASIAQLEIYNYYSLYQEFVKISQRKIEAPKGTNENASQVLTQVSETLYRVADMMVLFRNLPQITEAQLPHLNEAMRLVDRIQPQDASSSLFLALLRTVELKTFLYERILKTSLGNAQACRVTLEVIPTRIQELFHRFGKIFVSLSVAFKKSSDALNETRASIKEAEESLEKIRQTSQATDLLAMSWTKILFSNEVTSATGLEGNKLLCQ